MAVLLVGMSVMAVMLTVAMPVWKQTTQREKETELVFRGEQYARAIAPVPAQERPRRPAAEHRRARRAALPPQEIQGSDHQRRLPAGARRPSAPRSQADAGAAAAPPRRPAPRRRRQLPAGRRNARPANGPRRGRHRRRPEQEQSAIDSRLQRPQPLQRVGVRLPAADADAGRRRSRRRARASAVPVGPGGRRGPGGQTHDAPRAGFNPFPTTPGAPGQPRRPGRSIVALAAGVVQDFSPASLPGLRRRTARSGRLGCARIHSVSDFQPRRFRSREITTTETAAPRKKRADRAARAAAASRCRRARSRRAPTRRPSRAESRRSARAAGRRPARAIGAQPGPPGRTRR